MKPHTVRRTSLLIALLFLVFFLSSQAGFSVPSGADISFNSTEYGPTRPPDMRNDTRGTITTVILNAVQQDQHWKAYIGNISGSYSLDDASNYTIYDWDLTGTITGQVYASRWSNVSWSSISCASHSLIIAESTFHNMTSAKPDRINATFNWSIHKEFQVGGNTIPQSTCNSTVTYVSDTRQVPTTSSPYQEVLVMDTTNSYLIYMTSINDGSTGYNDQTNDFQLIVAESDIKSSPTPYYFYVELR